MYCTVEDIIARHSEEQLKKLTQVSGASSQLDEARIAIAISDASNLINNKLCNRYVVPIIDSGFLTKIAVDISFYFIHRNRHDNEIPKEVKDVYLAAIQTLDAIKSGKESIQGAVELPVKVQAVKTNQGKFDRVFTSQSMKWI